MSEHDALYKCFVLILKCIIWHYSICIHIAIKLLNSIHNDYACCHKNYSQDQYLSPHHGIFLLISSQSQAFIFSFSWPSLTSPAGDKALCHKLVLMTTYLDIVHSVLWKLSSNRECSILHHFNGSLISAIAIKSSPRMTTQLVIFIQFVPLETSSEL